MDLLDVFAGIAKVIFTQAGLVAGLLFIYSVYVTWDNRGWRKENKALNERLIDLGGKQIETAVTTNAVLDKVAGAIQAMSDRINQRR